MGVIWSVFADCHSLEYSLIGFCCWLEFSVLNTIDLEIIFLWPFTHGCLLDEDDELGQLALLEDEAKERSEGGNFEMILHFLRPL